MSFVTYFFFLIALAVAEKVLRRTHTLNGSTVEVSRHSITDEFQAKDGSGDQVRPSAESLRPFTVFHFASSITESKSFFKLLIA